MRLGDISKKYESNGDPGVIGYDKEGGSSYGSYQIAIKPGTLRSYVKKSSFDFSGLELGSEDFNDRWVQYATNDPERFEEDQHLFIQRSHYDPVRRYATKHGFPDTDMINQALWSIGVQHGKYSRILSKVDVSLDESHILGQLYVIRGEYVKKIYNRIGGKYGTMMKENIVNKRYVQELTDIQKHFYGSPKNREILEQYIETLQTL